MNRSGVDPRARGAGRQRLAGSTCSRRRFLLALAGGGAVLAGGLLAACSGGPAPPAAKGEPTLVPTALPTAQPAGGRPTSTVPASASEPTAAGTAPALATEQAATQTAVAARPTPAPKGGAAERRDLVILQEAEITTLDPHRSTLAPDLNAAFALFDNLTFRNEDQSVIRPMLAMEWRVQERRWELTLRPNVRFHNGDPLTAEDVKFSIERALDLRSPGARTSVANVFSVVERIETPDPLTVVFVTRHPDPLLPARLAFSGGQIVPKAYVQRIGATAFRQRPVGTGPYRFGEWVAGDRLVLERFDGYWGGAAEYDRVVFRSRPEAAARVAALLDGRADLVTSVPTDQLEAIARSGRARMDGALANGLHVLAVNSRVPPLDNPLMKQALSLAIDRESIVKTVHHGQGVVPNGLIAQGDFGFDATLPPLEHNPDRARRRLQEGGYRGEEIVLETTRGYLPGDREMAEIVHEMWRAVGVNSKLEQIAISAHADKIRDSTFKGLWWSDPVSTLLDPDGMMYRLLGPDSTPAYWRHAEWEKLGEEARSSLNQELRLRNYRRMNEIALEHLPWIPVVQPRRLYGIANTVEFRPYGNGYLNLRRENVGPR